MKLSRRHLAQVIAERTLGLPESKLAHEIAAFLLEHNHTAQLEPLVRDIMVFRREHGVVEATAVSARDFTPQVLQELKTLLRQYYPTAKKIIIDKRLDPSVVGGVRLDLAREQLDLTVQAKLNKFKRLTSERAI